MKTILIALTGAAAINVIPWVSIVQIVCNLLIAGFTAYAIYVKNFKTKGKSRIYTFPVNCRNCSVAKQANK